MTCPTANQPERLKDADSVAGLAKVVAQASGPTHADATALLPSCTRTGTAPRGRGVQVPRGVLTAGAIQPYYYVLLRGVQPNLLGVLSLLTTSHMYGDRPSRGRPESTSGHVSSVGSAPMKPSFSASVCPHT
jgi:hypothetical protein